MKNLLIVESPNKAKTIRQWLDSKYWIVYATGGHIIELPRKKYSIDINNEKTIAKWQVQSSKKTLIEEIKRELKNIKDVYIGTDDDREGERIGFDVIEQLKIKNYFRVLFHEITKDNILDSLKNGLYIDNDRVEAQKARRIIDRIIGYPISSAMRDTLIKQKKASFDELKNKGIGRVSAPALNIIVQNERIIEKFIPKKYRKIFINYSYEGQQFTVHNGMKFYEEHYEELSKLQEITLNPEIEHVVEKYKQDTRDVAPYPPLITSRIYRNLNYLYHYDTDKSEKILQKLFEGIEFVNETTNKKERIGLITYPRTDSFNLSDSAVESIRECLLKKFEPEYVSETKRVYENKNKNAQEAHEAIRPTKFDEEFFPKNLRKKLTKEQFTDEEFNVYEYIFYRTLSTQMRNSIYDNSKIVVNIGGNKFQCIGNKQLFDGWEVLLGTKIKKSEDEEDMDIIEVPTTLKIGDVLKTKDVTLSEPKNDKTPPRIGLGRFITMLDEKNIARPSTIASVPKILINSGYVKIINNMLKPTELGATIIKFLEEHGEWLIDIEHTEQFEAQLDEIEKGQSEAIKLIMEYDNLKDEFLDKLGFSYGDNKPQQWLIDKAQRISEHTGLQLSQTELTDVKKLKEVVEDYEKTTKVIKCPECKKSDVHEREKTFSCNNPSCDFTLWKNNIETFFLNFEKYMPTSAYKDLIKQIIEVKKVWMDDLYSKKKQSSFGAFIVLEKAQNGKSFNLQLQFSRSKIKTIDEKYKFILKENLIRGKKEELLSKLKKEPEIKKVETIRTETTNFDVEENTDNELLNRINKLEEEKRLLIDANNKDQLTRVFNRGKFDKDIKAAWSKRDNELILAFIDFDKFKLINDTYGHQSGDEVLIKSSNTIYELIRNFDVEIYRYGGEEFCLLSTEDRTLTNEILETIKNKIKQQVFVFNNQEKSVTISIGVTFRERDDDILSFIKRADEMVYKAKENGRDRIELSIKNEGEVIAW